MYHYTAFFPKIGKTTLNVSIIHFLLMFGYKLFSLFYPLYLVSIGFSIINVGLVYFLISISIAIATVGADFWIHKINPAKTASLGIFGYGVYALIMLLNPAAMIFYSAQILLGISAALWLVSLKSIIIESRPQNYNSSFGWFYSAPEYAAALAPLIGGLIIYKFGFTTVFAVSVFIQFSTAVWSYLSLRSCEDGETTSKTFDLKIFKENYQSILRSLKKDKVASSALVLIFIALIFGGIHRPYFVLFLKELNYTQNDIISFLSLLSILFIPLSWIAIKYIGKYPSYKNISFGSATSGIIFIFIALSYGFLNLIQVMLFLLIDTVASLMADSGKSGLLAEKFARLKEEASTIDTILVTLGPALGSIIGGIAISLIGFTSAFLLGSITVLIFSLMFYLHYQKFKTRTF